RLEELAQFLSRAGATVAAAAPGLDFTAYYYDYLHLLAVMRSVRMPREQRAARAATLRKAGHPASLARTEGLELDPPAYVRLVARRERARVAWRAFFRAWDVVLAPMTLDVAFPHQEGAWEERRLIVDNQSVPYDANLLYAMPAPFAGLPSTAFPGRVNAAGLPL